MMTPKSISHELVSVSSFVAATMRMEVIKNALSKNAKTYPTISFLGNGFLDSSALTCSAFSLVSSLLLAFGFERR